jgi:hypothetical protein
MARGARRERCIATATDLPMEERGGSGIGEWVEKTGGGGTKQGCKKKSITHKPSQIIKVY